MVSANLLEPGENALVLNSGYFGDSFAECLETYGGKVDQLKAPIGDKPSVSQIEQALKAKQYKVSVVGPSINFKLSLCLHSDPAIFDPISSSPSPTSTQAQVSCLMPKRSAKSSSASRQTPLSSSTASALLAQRRCVAMAATMSVTALTSSGFLPDPLRRVGH